MFPEVDFLAEEPSNSQYLPTDFCLLFFRLFRYFRLFRVYSSYTYKDLAPKQSAKANPQNNIYDQKNFWRPQIRLPAPNPQSFQGYTFARFP